MQIGLSTAQYSDKLVDLVGLNNLQQLFIFRLPVFDEYHEVEIQLIDFVVLQFTQYIYVALVLRSFLQDPYLKFFNFHLNINLIFGSLVYSISNYYRNQWTFKVHSLNGGVEGFIMKQFIIQLLDRDLEYCVQRSICRNRSLQDLPIISQFHNYFQLMAKNLKIILFATILRLVLIHILSTYETSQKLIFTDIDYKVFTQAGLHVLNGQSPYQRHTYRYSPLLSYLMIFNQQAFHIGKYLLLFFDLVAMILIDGLMNKNAVYFYALNPVFIYLTVRGSCQSITCSLLFLMYYLHKKKFNFLKGLFYGLWVHFRVYPIIFGLSFLFYYGRNNMKKAIVFIIGSAIGFIPLLGYFYYLYGYDFLENTYLYHLTRVDHRHNLSIYFYSTYLGMSDNVTLLQQILWIFPQLYLFGIITYKLSRNFQLSVFCLSWMFVLFNKVLTVQYYMWSFSAFILVIQNNRIFVYRRWRKLVHLFAIWLLGILVWVWLSNKIEGQGDNMFTTMWISCVGRFIGQAWIFHELYNNLDWSKYRKIKDN